MHLAPTVYPALEASGSETAPQNSSGVVLQSELSQEEAAFPPQQISALTCGAKLPSLKVQEGRPRLRLNLWGAGQV